MPYLVFDINKAQLDLWKSIIEAQVDGMADANLQDKMEVFGNEVDEKLEQLIDDYGVEDAFRVEFWNHKDTEFSVMIYSPEPEHKKALMELLSACPITNLHYGEDVD